ncbi:hypothetical protein Agabi119p4_7398 [Agaricus bisporus var. burnettii]|uniref:THIF-type NAD/FAD binding fold domain-containing protein n=1 Tax=Agaricus bisporus var. burnettii TaxID=192524 RepID=A0A8H7EZH2_AGABI|nr:hypothetical protein Agabi119p4_7398 [Agaricus bisporus var. burnettii]
MDISSDEMKHSSNAGKTLTEEEATRYDRQMRLWGIEAQQRMRNAVILVVRMRGVATEAIKNMVLAGIGKLVIVDAENVAEEDLGCGFFFREEDVGQKRLDVARPRIEGLNPLVNVETITDMTALEGVAFENLIQRVDLVCVTDNDNENLRRINEICRRYGKSFYAGGSYGFFGYIFCDLIEHEYLPPILFGASRDRTAPKEAPRTIKRKATYCPLAKALEFKWTALNKRQTKEVNPALFFGILGLWQYEISHKDLPLDSSSAAEVQTIANSLMSTADVNKQVLREVPIDLIESLSDGAKHEFNPVCAIIGGVLGQDILKALGGRDPPIANFFVFDGSTGGGTVCRLNMS